MQQLLEDAREGGAVRRDRRGEAPFFPAELLQCQEQFHLVVGVAEEAAQQRRPAREQQLDSREELPPSGGRGDVRGRPRGVQGGKLRAGAPAAVVVGVGVLGPRDGRRGGERDRRDRERARHVGKGLVLGDLQGIQLDHRQVLLVVEQRAAQKGLGDLPAEVEVGVVGLRLGLGLRCCCCCCH